MGEFDPLVFVFDSDVDCALMNVFCSTLQVMSAMFCIEANCATVSLHGNLALRFFRSLDPSYSPPNRLAFMRIVRLLDQAVMREYRRIISDNAILYGSNFVSSNSDFYTNKERRESFGCLVANTLAQQYVFEVRHASESFSFVQHSL